MIADHGTNVVFISDLLLQEHPGVVEALWAVLGKDLRTIPGTKDIWCRDFMPIQVAPERFVQFRYDPDYLKDYPHLRTDDAARLLDLTKDCVRSDLVIDGGNVVRWNNTAILTNKIYKENKGVSRPDLRRQLETVLEVDRLVIISPEPDEPIGHSDGLVRFVDESTVLVNDYRKLDPAFGESLHVELRRHNLEIVHFPYCPTDEPGPDPEIPPAIGVYINFLQIAGTIFCPTFSLREDDDALKLLEKCFPANKIIPVPSSDLAEGGGVLNCASWNIKLAER